MYQLEDASVLHYKILNVLTKSPIKYSYFKEHFSYSIDFLKNALVKIDCGNSEDSNKVYENYDLFAKEYLSEFKVDKKKNVIAIPLVVLFLYDIRNQMSSQLNFVAVDDYNINCEKNYYNDYFISQKEVCDKYFNLLLSNQVERFTFDDKNNFLVMQNLYNKDKSIFGEIIYNLRGSARGYSKIDLELLKAANLHIEEGKVKYSKYEEKNEIRAYILFHIIFLKKRFSLFISSDEIKALNGTSSNINLVDNDAMNMIFDIGASGTLISLSLTFDFILEDIVDQKGLQKLVEEFQDIYGQMLIEGGENHIIFEKVIKHLEERLRRFPNTEFGITNRKGLPFNINSYVTTNNPKSYLDISRALGTKDFVQQKDRPSVRTYKKATNISEL